jgi:single-strand DNA-binding protein
LLFLVIFSESLGRVARRGLRKGSQIWLEGQLQTHDWTEKDGRERRTTEVVIGRCRIDLVILSDKRT